MNTVFNQRKQYARPVPFTGPALKSSCFLALAFRPLVFPAIGLPNTLGYGRPPGIELSARGPPAALNVRTEANRIISSEALPHVQHPPTTLAIAFFQLQAFFGQGIDQGLADAVPRLVAVHEHAVGLLEAGG